MDHEKRDHDSGDVMDGDKHHDHDKDHDRGNKDYNKDHDHGKNHDKSNKDHNKGMPKSTRITIRIRTQKEATKITIRTKAKTKTTTFTTFESYAFIIQNNGRLFVMNGSKMLILNLHPVSKLHFNVRVSWMT